MYNVCTACVKQLKCWRGGRVLCGCGGGGWGVCVCVWGGHY